METIASALATVILILIIVFILIILYKNSRSCKLLSQIPGPKANFLFGNALQFMVPERELLSTTVKLMQDFTKIGIAKVWLGYRPFVILMKAETIQPLMASKKEINKSTIYDFLNSGKKQESIAVIRGEAWHKRRKLLTPAFHYRVLEEFLKVFNEKSKSFVNKLENEVGKYVNMSSMITICTLDIICSTAMGFDMQATEEDKSAYMDACLQVTSAQFKRIISPWYHPDFIWKLSPLRRECMKNAALMDNLGKKILANKRQELNDRKLRQQNFGSDKSLDGYCENHKRPTAIDILVECTDDDGKSLSDTDILEEVSNLVFAGHESTALTIFWSLFWIGRNPEVQEKAHREVDRIFGDSDRAVNSEDLTELKYLECIYKEALRLCPSFPVIGRKIQDDLQIGQYTIPGGTDVAIPAYLIHRDPEYFPDPERFDPDRFLPQNTNGRHPFAYIPFSAGTRNCIGMRYAAMELKVVLSYILRNFKITSLYNGEVEMIVAMVLRPTPEETIMLLEKRAKYI